MAKILFVDDEPSVLEFLEQLFDEAGYETFTAYDGIAGLREFLAIRPDIAILDLMMPHMDGFELCRRIREISHVPLIVLTGLDQTMEKVQAFSAGADDYVTKPVSGLELIARVEACLQRALWPTVTDTSSVYSDSLLTVDHGRREVFLHGKRIELSPIEYSLLSLFVRRPGEALSLEYLLTNVWGREYESFELVKWHIRNLRKKLSSGDKKYGQAKPPPIVTVRGYGFRYVTPAELDSDTSLPQPIAKVAAGSRGSERGLVKGAELERFSTIKPAAVTENDLNEFRAVCGATAHGLKGEFMHIAGAAQSIRDLVACSKTAKDVQEECDMIERSAKYSQLAFQKVLDFMDLGKPDVEPVDVPHLLKETERLLTPRLPSNIHLEVDDKDFDHPPRVLANAVQLMGIVVELVNNAASVLKGQGGRIALRLDFRKIEAALTIKDDGPGIPMKLRDSILMRRVPSESGGLGLGLWLCNRVVQGFGGHLYFETSSDTGTTFTILLPLFIDLESS